MLMLMKMMMMMCQIGCGEKDDKKHNAGAVICCAAAVCVHGNWRESDLISCIDDHCVAKKNLTDRNLDV